MRAGAVLALCLSAALAGPPATAAERRPLGDGRIASTPQVGHVFSCQTRFGGGGAHRQGPWIQGGSWDPGAKPTVGGEVAWPDARIAIAIEGDRRVVRANGLPSHTTGIFPVRPEDPAARFDRNPNRITPQAILLSLPAEPVSAAQPTCVPMGMIGFALTGVAIFNALDDMGRDAPAHEIQDRCNGHPEPRGQYHYHDLSPCLRDRAGAEGRHSDLIGYALDGFGLYGRFGENGRALTSADLDACHGHTHPVSWDGRTRAIYHYHLTPDYPYTVGCFRGTVAEVAGTGPGRPTTGAPPPPGGPPDRDARLQRAAAALGVDPARLRDALGPPPPDFARAARLLAIDEERLRRAMAPEPPTGGGAPPQPPPGGGPASRPPPR